MASTSVTVAYGEYLKTTDSPGYPISFKLADFLWRFCRACQPRTILDLGSGFSSWLFRRYGGAEVVSVDDDPHYLQRTIDFCGTDEGFVLWNDSLRRTSRTFDLVFVDYAGGDIRNAIMGWAADRVAAHGAIIFDDMHFAPHQEAARAACVGMKIIDLADETKELATGGRFAMLAVRDEGWTMPEDTPDPAPVESALDRALAKVKKLEDEIARASEQLQSARAEAHQARVAGEIETR